MSRFPNDASLLYNILMVTLYNVISSDGFIARPDGSEDFIPNNLWINFLNLLKEYDVFVMGRKTYDTMQHYDPTLLVPFEKLPITKIVVTDNHAFIPKEGYIVTHSPEDAFANGRNILVSSGPSFNNSVLKKGLVNEVIFHEIPVAIGRGIKPFDENTGCTFIRLPDQPPLEDVTVRAYSVAPAGGGHGLSAV